MNRRSPTLMAIVTMLSLFSASCSSTAKHPAGLSNGTLSPCPDSPNCVVSEEVGRGANIQPLVFDVAPAQAWQTLQLVLKNSGGTIESVNDNYLWATFRSKVFRFVDDVECRLDREQGVIHLRSAARVGYSDFGVNRKRMEHVRQAFKQHLGQNTTVATENK